MSVNNRLINTLGRAAVIATAQSAEDSNKHDKKLGVSIYRANERLASFSALGFIPAVIFTFVPFEQSSNVARIFLVLLFGILGALLLLFFLVSRAYINDESITVRNPFGIKKSLRWLDIEYAYRSIISGDITLCGAGKRLKVYGCFNGIRNIRDIINDKRPGVFSPRARLKSKGSVIFKYSAASAVIGSIIILIGIALALFLPLDGYGNKKYVFVAFFIAGSFGIGGYLILHYLISGIYIDSEKITYVNAVGAKRYICWRDLTSVRELITRDDSGNKYFKLAGAGKKLNIYCESDHYDAIKKIIKSKSPAAFSGNENLKV